ncbi:hypothetical protein KKH56_03960 [bacterium]|nr:hypothetical protein [bacterium]
MKNNETEDLQKQITRLKRLAAEDKRKIKRLKESIKQHFLMREGLERE